MSEKLEYSHLRGLAYGALVQIAATQRDGDKKHGGAYNWRDCRTYARDWVAGMRRHLDAYESGCDADHESGQHPLTHLAARCIIVLDAIGCGTLIDDRREP